PLADLCWWGDWPEPPLDGQVLLADGSLIVGDVSLLDKERAVVEWEPAGSIKLPLETVAGIIFSPPLDRDRADLLRFRLWAASGDSDRLLLRNGDELTGEVLGLDAASVKIRAAAGELSVQKDKIAGLAFNPSLAAKPRRGGLQTWVGFADGSRLLAAT